MVWIPLFGNTCFILNYYVPIILFFQLMAQYLYPVILAIIEAFNGQDANLKLSPNWSEFSYSWTCVIILIITFLMALPRDISVYN